MKKLICMFLAVTMLIAASPAVYASEKNALEVGDRIVIGTYKGEPVEYKVMGARDVDGDSKAELFLASSKIISFKGYNAGASGNYAVSWKTDMFGRQPSLRVWLNSNATTVDYGMETDGTTAVIPPYSEQPGFLAGMTDFEQSKIVAVTHNTTVADFHDKTHEHLPIDGGSGHFATWSQTFPAAYTTNKAVATYDNAAYVTTTDKVFIPSIKDIYDFFGGSIDNATAVSNLNVGATATAQAEVAAGSEALYQNSNTLLRDIYFEDRGGLGSSTPYRWNGTYAICNSGMRATSVGGIRPCMYIKADVEVEETESGSGIYQMKLPVRASISVKQNGSELIEVAEGDINITGSARASVEADIIAAVFRTDSGMDIMEDYTRSSDLNNIDITLTALGTGNRYVGVFFWDRANKSITSAQYVGGAPSVLWSVADEVSEIISAAVVNGETIAVSGTLPNDGSTNLGVVVKKTGTEIVTYVNQFSVGNDKSFSFSLKAENLFGGTSETVVEGWYDIVLTTDNVSKTIKAGIAGPGIWTGLLTKINAGETEYVTNSFLNENGYELEYNSVTDKGFYLDEYKANSALLNQTIGKLITNKPSTGYTAESVVSAFNKYMTEAYFDAATAVDKFTILENDKYDALLEVDGISNTESYKNVKTFSMVSNIFDGVTAENITTKIYENIAIVTIANTENSSAIQTVIEEYANELGIQFGEAYANLSGTKLKTLYDSFFVGSVSTKADIIRIFNASYAEAIKVIGGGTGGSGGGTGGGGGGLSIVTPEPTNKQDEEDKPEEITKPEDNKPNVLKDIDELTWGKDAVVYLVDKGIISGNGNGEFRPDDNITREQLAKIVTLAFEIKSDGEANFQDVKADEWYAEYVNILASKGIINGISNAKFGVGENITRQDLAVIVYRVLKNKELIETSEEAVFADDENVADYAREAIRTLAKAGFVNGYDDNTFRGENCITRQEAAQIIYNIIGGAK